jgi:branched-chain amino acid transport system permease protein
LKIAGLELPGMKQVVYGVLLLFTVSFLPNGLWPPLKRVLTKKVS